MIITKSIYDIMKYIFLDVDKVGEMKAKVEEITSNFKVIGELSPEQMSSFNRFMRMTEKRGALNPREKELISIALSICAHCEWCIAYHVKKALEHGATKKEIIESAWVSVLMGGGPALMYAQLVLEALNEFKPEEKEDVITFGLGIKDEEIDNEFKILYNDLLKYVNKICDTVTSLCHSDANKRRLALNIAESDGHILERLVEKECKKRGWENSENEEDIEIKERDNLKFYKRSIKQMNK